MQVLKEWEEHEVTADDRKTNEAWQQPHLAIGGSNADAASARFPQDGVTISTTR